MKCMQFQVGTPSAFLLNTWYSWKERSPQSVHVLVLIWMLIRLQWAEILVVLFTFYLPHGKRPKIERKTAGGTSPLSDAKVPRQALILCAKLTLRPKKIPLGSPGWRMEGFGTWEMVRKPSFGPSFFEPHYGSAAHVCHCPSDISGSSYGKK